LTLFRLRPDRSQDASFGDGGSTRIEFPGATGAQLTSVLTDSADRIYVAAATTATVPGDYNAHLVFLRFTPDGRPDPSFGDQGSTTVEIPEYPLSGPALVALTDTGEVYGLLDTHPFEPGSDPDVYNERAVVKLDASGRPVRDAVVTYYPAAGARAPHPGGHYVVSQKNIQFHPFLTIIPVGADVSFPNFDSTKHHVYSFSPAKRFELKLFAKDQSRTVHFDKPGVVALGCNIHDQMSAFIVVTDSAWTARTNAQGIAAFADAPNAPGRVTVWHPYLRSPTGIAQQGIAAAQRSASFSIRLRLPPAMPAMDY
jgi:plastocyanin